MIFIDLSTNKTRYITKWSRLFNFISNVNEMKKLVTQKTKREWLFSWLYLNKTNKKNLKKTILNMRTPYIKYQPTRYIQNTSCIILFFSIPNWSL